jgi:hypothetical protein
MRLDEPTTSPLDSLPMNPRPLRLAAFAAAGLCVALSAAAARPVAVADGERVRVVVGGEGSVALPATAGLRVENVVGAAAGWVAAGTSGEGGFAVFAGDAAQARRLPAPPLGGASLHREPLPLLDDAGALAGLAWLEGEGARSLAVRFARWDGTRWQPPVTVSAPGPGTQIALAAAALADGTLLLVWSAFDGGDDEVMWSAWDGDAWSRPARVAADNAVPDVTPALVAVDGGALAAWSRFDGTTYRVVTARFAEGRWSAPVAVAPGGSVLPSFEAAPHDPAAVAPRLLVRTAVPRGWLLLELDAAGHPLRRAFVAAGESERPVIEGSAAGGEVTLAWPGRDLPRTASWDAVRPGTSR